tara:strand:- start:2034 stop:2354 length:321 start_codon:yes stop_codon:yes gene_type:complete
MLLSSVCFADITINYNIPATYPDGSAIPAGSSYNIYHWHENASQPIVSVSEDIDTYVYDDDRIGMHVFIGAAVINGIVQKKSDPFGITIPEKAAAKTYIITVQETP